MQVYRSIGNDSKTIDDILEAINGLLDSTNINEVGGFDVVNNDTGTQTIAVDTNILLDSTNKAFSINSATFGNQGFQVQYNAGTPRLYVGDGANQYFQFDGTNISWKGTNTSLSAAGAFVATSATITGSVTATSGTIGGWTISATTLANGTNIILDSSNKAISVNNATYGTDGFQVQYNAGNPRLYIGDGANQYFQFNGTAISFKGSNAELTVGGTFTASDANITGTITATDGRIANWYINTNTISSGSVEATSNVLIDSANSLLRLGPTATDYLSLDGANKRIRSSNYVSGAMGAGFTLEPDLLEVGNIKARGMFNATTFQKDVVSAIGGQLLVTNADTLNTDMDATDACHLETVNTTSFAVNDILLMQNESYTEYFRVTNVAGAPDYIVTRDLAGAYGANANPAWQKGTAVVNLGSSDGAGTYSGGWLYMKGAGINAPYYAVVKRTSDAYNGYTEYLRLGELNGFLDYVASEYGFAVGDTSDYISFDPTNNLRINTSTADAITINYGGNILLNEGGNIQFDEVTAPTACTATLVVTGVGNVDNGTHSYKVTYTNVGGTQETELGTISNVVTVDAAHKQVALSSIPTSTSSAVGQRKIYRTKAGGTTYWLLTTLANNSATTYTDNTADANLGLVDYTNKKNNFIGVVKYNTSYGLLNGLQIFLNNTGVGLHQFSGLSTGFANEAFGDYALYSLTTGSVNTAIGNSALRSITSGFQNVALGSGALSTSTADNGNTAIGFDSLQKCDGGTFNIGVGAFAGQEITTGDSNVMIGYGVGTQVTTGGSNVFIGYEAASASGNLSNKLYIENSNSATPLIYGEFDNDFITINGDLHIGGSNKELRFYEGANYVGFEAPALSADKIWVLPSADGSTNSMLKTDGSGTLGWQSPDGWKVITGTFTYASATTINVSSGAASIYKVGDKLRFQNNSSGTYLYVYVRTVADTLLTVVGNAVPNATLTDKYYSHEETPLGFPGYFTYTATITGFSGTPNQTCVFTMSGNKVSVVMQVDGTSNANTFIVSLPVTSVAQSFDLIVRTIDAGTASTAGLCQVGGTTATFYKDTAGSAFTTSGAKQCYCNFFYYV